MQIGEFSLAKFQSNKEEVIALLVCSEIYPETLRPETFTLRHWNTGLVSSGASLTSWGEGASLALVGNPSSNGITIKMPYGVDVLHRPASHPIFSYWVG